ncbi:MAG: SDR family oxidoreductase, partial [Paracoccus sp. (in: a-proteobacteria)]
MRLQGKTALVTGAASGFGQGIAETYAREGARVAVIDLNEAGAKAVAAELGGDAIAIACDVSQGDQVEAAVQAALTAFGRLDIAVNNAGWTNPNRPLMETDEATFRRILDINVLSIFHMTRSCVPVWRAQGGGVMINIGSTAGIRPRPGLTWYNASKGAVNLMSRSLAVELAPDRIRVNCIAPVMGVTGLLEQFMGMPDTPENREKFLATIPLGRLSQP